MGNDGGSIPDRRDLVKTKAKAEQADKANQTRAKWFYCALSKRKLEEPVVSCALGKLYNKLALIEFLLDRSAYGDGERICGHIRSLKDVKELKLTPNPVAASSDSSPDDLDRASFVCPLNLKEMNGSQPFVYLPSCGCVFSQAGLKTIASSDSSSPSPPPPTTDKDATENGEKPPLQEELSLCPQCGKKYAKQDTVRLNPSPEEEMQMRFALERKRASEPSKKKSKKRKNESADPEEPPAKKPVPSLNPSMAAASRAVTSGLAMEEAKRKAGMTAAIASLYGDGKPKTKETFMTRGTFTRYA